MSVSMAGCMCGAAAVPTSEKGKGAIVDHDGVVVYDQTPVGETVSFEIPVKDTADVDETIVSASITGEDADAFEIHARFPMDMPGGETVHVEVEFHPTKSGKASAELLIQTRDMGVSPAIELTGVGVDEGGN